MSTLGQAIKTLRESHGLTQAQFGNLVGVSDKAVSTWENGLKQPRMGVVQKISDYFNIPKSALLDGGESEPLLPGLLHVRPRRVPLLGEIAAGVPIYAQESYDTYITCNDGLVCDFALRVKGDSMSPRLLDGDVVFIRRCPEVPDGQIAAVLVDDSATLKRVYRLPHGSGLQLVSENPSYSPMLCNARNSDHVEIIGQAVAYQRKMV